MPTEDNKLDQEIYKVLYDFQLKGLESIKALHAKLEDKAAKYLTFISIIIAALTIFSKQYFFDKTEKDFFFYIVLILITLIFISLCTIARNLFQVMEVSKVGKLENNQQMINFFTQNEITTIYYNLSMDLASIIKIYEDRNAEKVEYLNKAFKEIKFCGLMFILTVLLIVISTLVS